MGPNSPYWQPYTADSKAVFSIGLARSSMVSASKGRLMQTTASTNVTFGKAGDSSYLEQPSVTVTSASNFSYSLNRLGLGPIYYNDSVAISYFYKYLSVDYPVQMNINFVGLGVPYSIYNRIYTLLNQLEDDLSCSSSQDGFCTLNNPCSSYEDEGLNYVLDFNFTTNTTYSMRVPLATFVVDGPVNAEGNTTCIF